MPGDDPSRGTGAQTAETAERAAASGSGVDSHADTAMVGAHDETMVGEGAETTARDPDELVGTTLQKRYQITRKIGQGGMGAVYEATHVGLGKKVAVKVLLDKYTTKDRVVARLEQEARLASSIGHDNIVDITDFGETAKGRTFVVMEYLEGESLGQLISREGALDEARSVRIARQVSSALGAAHQKGIVHRDIKPENVFLRHRRGRDVVKVVDFGISKTMNKPEEDGGASPRLTQTGMVLGTPLYMSPEQARGDENPDHRIDIYSLGVIMYEMATGEVPFSGGNYLNIVSQVISQDPKSPRELNPKISLDFEAVILKALEKEPEDRYQTMEELEADLTALDDGELGSTSARITASRRRRKRKQAGWIRVVKWAGATAVILSLVVIAVIMIVGRGDNEAASNDPLPDPTPVVTPDAAPEITVDVDAAAPSPDTPMKEFTLKSNPAGARILRDGNTFLGLTPKKIELVKKDKDVKFVFTLDGYDYAEMSLNPLESRSEVMIELKKPKKGPAKRYTPKPDGGKGSGSAKKDPRHDDGGGDLLPLK